MLNPFKQIIELERQNKGLRDALVKARNDLKDPIKVLESIIDKKIEWYDYKKLNKQQQTEYYNDIQMILNTEAFNNELQHFMADMLKTNLLDTKDFNQVMNIRTAFVTLESLKDRFAKIENPSEIKTKDDIYNPI